jgi:hypothetical protein
VTEPEHELADALRDSLALVECAAGDPEGFGAILRNADHPRVTVVLSKLLCELVNDSAAGLCVCAECFRDWASSAIERS